MVLTVVSWTPEPVYGGEMSRQYMHVWMMTTTGNIARARDQVSKRRM